MKIFNFKYIFSFFVFLIIVLFGNIANAECRFWTAIGDKIPKDVVADGLLTSSNCLMNLSTRNRNGWGIGYYVNGDAILVNGILPAYQDPVYQEDVLTIAEMTPDIVVAHIRQAASGCRNVKNPHPFVRNNKGKVWFFGHNGVINKKLLIELIGKEYLDEHLPVICDYDPPNSWVDSELYFIFVLKNINESSGNVEEGIRSAIHQIKSKLGRGRGTLNFFLTDGDKLWTFRKGHTLYYYRDPQNQYAIIASTPSDKKEGWVDVPEYSLITVDKNSGLKLINVLVPKE